MVQKKHPTSGQGSVTGFLDVGSALNNPLSYEIIHANDNSNSTATISQFDSILSALRKKPCNTHELRCLGIYQVGARIKDLREMGYIITTHRANVKDDYGYIHKRVAIYTLVGKTEEKGLL